MNPSLKFLYSLQSFGIKLGLRNIRILLNSIGNPERAFPCIHIAGTNGKGSTSAMLAAILTASGYRTGLYTSPHLIDFNERIRIDGNTISDDDLAKHTRILKPTILETKATFFEATTAISFNYFAEHKVDIAIIETGLGGRFDATNVITPLMSIITNIGLDHTEQLGTTLRTIAYEKAGVIKSEIPCFTGETKKEPLSVLRRAANKQKAPLVHFHQNSTLNIIQNTLSGVYIHLKSSRYRYQNLFVSLPGNHQARNAEVAIGATEYLKVKHGYKHITKASITKGLGSIRGFTGFRGRCDIVNNVPLTIIDVAHNPDGLRTAISSLRRLLVNKPVVVFGVMKDKDYASMISDLTKFARHIIAVQPRTMRALESERIVQKFHTYQFPVIDGKSVANGFMLANQLRRDDEAIVVIGSHYVAGEVYSMLDQKKDTG